MTTNSAAISEGWVESVSPRAVTKGSSILGLQNLTKRFGAITALENVSVDINKGEFITVIGPSGCGKSTLFNIVAGLDSPDDGHIAHHSRAIDARELLGQVAFMPQQDLLLPWRTVLDNAILAIELEGTPRAKARAQALKMLPEFGLKGTYVTRRAVRRTRFADAFNDAALAVGDLAASRTYRSIYYPRH